MPEHKKLKYYYDKELAKLLAGKIKDPFPEFDDITYIKKVSISVDELELKARVEIFADCLHEFLPSNYKKAVSILVKILGPENKKETGMFTEGYWLMPVAYFIEKYGTADLGTSVNAIAEITKRHTGEYAVRPFLKKHTKKMLVQMKKWSNEKNVHLRRLACEGVRPRLPWAKRLDEFIESPELIMPILENLKEDESKFVQKSVANCMNDILKDNYDMAMSVLGKWASSDNKNTKWIVKHALRNEIKKKNPGALELIKY
jgi:3-methyladenine DNA glycosylase AlkC